MPRPRLISTAANQKVIDYALATFARSFWAGRWFHLVRQMDKA